MGSDFSPLTSRLESSIEEKKAELQRLGKPVRSFLHMAAKSLVSECEADPDWAHQVNVVGSASWFEAAAQLEVPHFVFLSTSHVYGKINVRRRVSVDHPVCPVNAYGRLKLEAENLLRELAQKYPRTKLTIARLFSVLSPSGRPGFLYTNLHLRAQRHDFSPIPGLSYVRDFLHVEEVIPKVKRLALWMEAPPIVHICSGEGRTVREIAQMVFAEYGLDASGITQAPGGPDDIAWIIGEPTPGL